MQRINTVVVIGPESTGKSTLCSLLAAHFGTIWCPEYAREYLLVNGTDYTYADLLTIARGQRLLQAQAEQQLANEELPDANGELASNMTYSQLYSTQHKLLFVDTDMYVMKVWCEYVFQNCHSFILEEIVQQQCSLYILCRPDIAWVEDELREYPDEQVRIELYHIYRDILINQNVPWIEVSGGYDQRFKMGAEAVERVLLPPVLPPNIV